MELVNALKQNFPEIEFIAEDLGEITPDVGILLKESGLPGMKVLEYAFSPYEINDYLPHRTTENFICYTGTHDNSPLQLWRKQVPEEEIAFAKRYLGLNDEEGFNEGIIRGGMSCPAVLFVAQMQDWLNLGSEESRINFPGTDSGNWQWRMRVDALTDELAEKIHEMTRIYSRL